MLPIMEICCKCTVVYEVLVLRLFRVNKGRRYPEYHYVKAVLSIANGLLTKAWFSHQTFCLMFGTHKK